MAENTRHPPVAHLLRLERLLHAASWRRSDDEIWASPNIFKLFDVEFDEQRQDWNETFQNQLLSRVHASDVDALMQFAMGLDQNTESSIEFRATVRGVERQFRAVAANADGVRTGIIHDITSQRSAEREKRRAESIFQVLAEEMPAGIFLGTVEGEAKYANPALRRMLGVDSYDQIIWDEMIHPDDVDWLRAHYLESVERGDFEPYRFRVQIDGEVRTLETRQSFVPDTNQAMVVSSLIDQTDAVRRERQLIESDRQLEWSQRISNTATWNVVFEPHKIRWSRAMYRMLERDPDTFVLTYSSFLDHISPVSRDEKIAVVNDVAANGGSWDFDVQFVTATGRRIWTRSIGEGVVDSDGAIIGIRGVVQDISEMHELQERVRRAEKLRALGELAGGIAHDFNNMLAAILGNAEILADDLSGEALDDCRQIIDTARRCGDLTNQLLAFSRRRPLESRDVDIGQCIEGVVGLLQHAIASSIEIEWNLTTNPPLVSGEASLIENALLNVCINASQAMPGGGALTIDCEHTHLVADEWGEEFDVDEGPAVAIHITDTGVGIAEENLARVLDPFFSTRRELGGTGLGLATTFGIVRNHGGAIRLASELGQGTCVTVIFPASKSDSLSDSDEFAGESLELADVVALVVDDELAVRKVVGRHLSSLGAVIESAGGHREALKMIKANAAAKRTFGIGIFDLSMPDGQGTDTARFFAEVWPESAVLIISGFDVNTALDRDRDTYPVLQKPFTKEGLARAVKAALEQHNNA